MSAPAVVFLVAVWVLWGAFTFWVMLDSVYGDRHLPGVVDSEWGLIAMFGWILATTAPVVALSTWMTV